MDVSDLHRQRIVRILRESQVVDKTSNWIYLNRIWHKPTSRREFCSILYDICQPMVSIINNPTLVCPEGLYSSFGTLPFVSILSYELDTPLVLWKELGEIMRARPQLSPNADSLPQNVDCIIIHDVINNGTTLRKLCPTLARLGWQIRLFISIIQIEAGSDNLHSAIDSCKQDYSADFRFIRIATDTELKA